MTLVLPPRIHAPVIGFCSCSHKLRNIIANVNAMQGGTMSLLLSMDKLLHTCATEKLQNDFKVGFTTFQLLKEV